MFLCKLQSCIIPMGSTIHVHIISQVQHSSIFTKASYTISSILQMRTAIPLSPQYHITLAHYAKGVKSPGVKGVVWLTSYSPRMSYGLLTGVSLLGVQFHQVANEVLGRLRNLIPVWGIKLIVSLHDLMKELSVILMVERRVTTQPMACVCVCARSLQCTCTHTCM